MARIIKITRPISLVEDKLVFKPSKEAMAAEAVSSPDPFNAGFKDAETITGVTAWFLIPWLCHRDGLWWPKVILARFA
jgi:hypothetical protein